MGGLMLGMMTRSARGHTGRELKAGPAAAALRVLGTLVGPEAGALAVDGAALLWSRAFAVFLVAYWLVLTRPRLDA